MSERVLPHVGAVYLKLLSGSYKLRYNIKRVFLINHAFYTFLNEKQLAFRITLFSFF